METKNTEQQDKAEKNCKIHEHHDHQHGYMCGHEAIKHNDHYDYVHDGHLHRIHGKHVDECEGNKKH